MSRPPAVTHNDESVETKSTWLLKMLTLMNQYYTRHALKCYQILIQETLVHAPKLWAEEISKRASLFP